VTRSRAQNLQCDRSVDLRVVGLVDNPHGAFASSFTIRYLPYCMNAYFFQEFHDRGHGMQKPTYSVPRYRPLISPIRLSVGVERRAPAAPGQRPQMHLPQRLIVPPPSVDRSQPLHENVPERFADNRWCKSSRRANTRARLLPRPMKSEVPDPSGSGPNPSGARFEQPVP